MIRIEWSLASMLLSMVSGLLILLPILAYGGISFFSSILPTIGLNGAYLYIAWLLSGIIALAIWFISYRASVGYAHKLLGAAE
jgi:hypothetical protein